MISCHKGRSVDASTAYFETNVRVGDYYSQDDRTPGKWSTVLAKRLGIANRKITRDSLLVALKGQLDRCSEHYSELTQLRPPPYTVVNTSSDPETPGSLSYVLNQATNSGSFQVIEFATPGTGPFIIPVKSPISITLPVNIDGPSQPGYNGSPQVILDGQDNANILLLNNRNTNTIASLTLIDFA